MLKTRVKCSICGKDSGDVYEADLGKLRSDMSKQFILVKWAQYPKNHGPAHAECVLGEIRKLRKTSS